ETVKPGRVLRPGAVEGREVVADNQDLAHSESRSRAAILWAVAPSQSGGRREFSWFEEMSLRWAASTRSRRRLATRVLGPSAMVTGRSVLARTVRHGTPRKVVSSCTPPESVMTRAALRSRARKSR